MVEELLFVGACEEWDGGQEIETKQKFSRTGQPMLKWEYGRPIFSGLSGALLPNVRVKNIQRGIHRILK